MEPRDGAKGGQESDALAALVEAARQGDPVSQADLFDRYRMRVVRYCLTFAGIQPADALDLTQEVFLRALRNLRSLRESGRFEGWLFAIARGRCLTHLVRQRQGRLSLERLAREDTPADDSREDRQRELERAVVAEEIARLPDTPLREAGRLFYLEGKDTGEIATLLSAPVSTVTTWLSRLRGKIRVRLVRRILELRGGTG